MTKKNKVIVQSKNLSNSVKLENLLVSHGFFDFTYSVCCDFASLLEEVKTAKNETETCIVVCKNEHIDKLLEEIKSVDDHFSLLCEQAVKVENSTSKMLFVPAEIGLEKFLKEFIDKKETYAFSVFGQSALNVENKLDLVEDFDYKIITKSSFLHTIFCSRELSKERLESLFGEGLLFCEDLAEKCMEILKGKGLSIAVAEQITSGYVASAMSQISRENLKEALLLNEKVYQKLGIDEAFLAEHGQVSKETAYELSKKMLKNFECDLALSIVGFDEDDCRCFVAIGNKEEIHVFSSRFSGQKEENCKNICDFALFRLLKFLSEKN